MFYVYPRSSHLRDEILPISGNKIGLHKYLFLHWKRLIDICNSYLVSPDWNTFVTDNFIIMWQNQTEDRNKTKEENLKMEQNENNCLPFLTME